MVQLAVEPAIPSASPSFVLPARITIPANTVVIERMRSALFVFCTSGYSHGSKFVREKVQDNGSCHLYLLLTPCGHSSHSCVALSPSVHCSMYGPLWLVTAVYKINPRSYLAPMLSLVCGLMRSNLGWPPASHL
jgi:hypothetical protein